MLRGAYTFKTLEELALNPEEANELMAKSKNTGQVQESEEPTVAVLLVSQSDYGKRTNPSQRTYRSLEEIAAKEPTLLTQVKGLSWYAVAKLINELLADPEKFKDLEFPKQIVELRNITDAAKEEKRAQNPARSVVITLVHGLHGFAVSKGVPDVPPFSASRKEKLEWAKRYVSSVKTKNEETTRKLIEGIFHFAVNQFLTDTSPKKLDRLLEVLQNPIVYIDENTKTKTKTKSEGKE